MDATREAEELVELWQELQEAQVAGDTRRLDRLRRLGEARARRAGASGEWSLLAREAGRHTGDLREEVETRPSAVPAGGAGEGAGVPVEEVDTSAVEAPEDAAEGDGERRRGLRLGPLVWVVIVVVYVLLQVLGEAGEGSMP